jgi:hypothetical protein
LPLRDEDAPELEDELELHHSSLLLLEYDIDFSWALVLETEDIRME